MRRGRQAGAVGRWKSAVASCSESDLPGTPISEVSEVSEALRVPDAKAVDASVDPRSGMGAPAYGPALTR